MACFVASLCLLIEAKAQQFVGGRCVITDSVSEFVLAWSSPELSAAPAPPLSLSQHLAASGWHVPAVHCSCGRPHAGCSATAQQQSQREPVKQGGADGQRLLHAVTCVQY